MSEDIDDVLEESNKIIKDAQKPLSKEVEKKIEEFTYDELIIQEDIKMEKEFRDQMDVEYKSEKDKLEEDEVQ